MIHLQQQRRRPRWQQLQQQQQRRRQQQRQQQQCHQHSLLLDQSDHPFNAMLHSVSDSGLDSSWSGSVVRANGGLEARGEPALEVP
jgi:hypothetical protein